PASWRPARRRGGDGARPDCLDRHRPLYGCRGRSRRAVVTIRIPAAPLLSATKAGANPGVSMPVIDEIRGFHDELTEWRRDIHAHPELGFEEKRTSDLVAEKLECFGIEVHRGIGKTGL